MDKICSVLKSFNDCYISWICCKSGFVYTWMCKGESFEDVYVYSGQKEAWFFPMTVVKEGNDRVGFFVFFTSLSSSIGKRWFKSEKSTG